MSSHLNTISLAINQIKNTPDIITIDNRKYQEIINCQYHFNLWDLCHYNWLEIHQSEAHRMLQGLTSKKYKGYYSSWDKGLKRCLKELNEDLYTRRAVIHFINDKLPCLETVQFLVRNHSLSVIANFRSWELENFALYDLCLLSNMSRRVYNEFHNITLNKLTVNVGSAHILLE